MKLCMSANKALNLTALTADAVKSLRASRSGGRLA